MATTQVSAESSSEDLQETPVRTYPVRRKASLLNRWKKSGLALRRYLYCLERKRSESSSNDEEKENENNMCIPRVQKDQSTGVFDLCGPHAQRNHSTQMPSISNHAEFSEIDKIQNEATCAEICTVSNIGNQSNCFCLQFKSPQSKSLNFTGGVKNDKIHRHKHNALKGDNSKKSSKDPEKTSTFYNADLSKSPKKIEDNLACEAGQEINTCTNNTGQKHGASQDRFSTNNLPVSLHHHPDLIPVKNSDYLDSFCHQQNTSINTSNYGNDNKHLKTDFLNKQYTDRDVSENYIPFSGKDDNISTSIKNDKISTLKQTAAEDKNAISGKSISRLAFDSADNFSKESFSGQTDFHEITSSHCDRKKRVQNSLESSCISCQEIKTVGTDFSSNSLLEKGNTPRNLVNYGSCEIVVDSETEPSCKYSKYADSHVTSLTDNLINTTTSTPDKKWLSPADNKSLSGLLSMQNSNNCLNYNTENPSAIYTKNHSGRLSIEDSKICLNSDTRNPSIVEIKNSTSLSSDSIKTDSSSICDMADESSEAVVECKSSAVPSPRRQRKKLKPRGKSPTDEDNEVGGEADIDVLETSLDYSPSGFLTSLSKIRLGSQLSEESTESETLSTGNPVFEDTDTTDSIPGLNFAIPYLSDRLKTRLAQRIGVGDLLNNGDTENGEMEKDGEKKCEDQQLTENSNQDDNSTQGQELLSSEATSGEYMTDERTLSDLLFNLDKIDMIDRVFLREDHSQDFGRLASIQVANHQHNTDETIEPDTASDGADADDEFECDCQFCIGTRSNQGQTGTYRDGEANVRDTGHETVHHIDDDLSRNLSEDDRINFWNDHDILMVNKSLCLIPEEGMHILFNVEQTIFFKENCVDRDFKSLHKSIHTMADEENIFTLNIEELAPLDILMNDRRSELEVMFENVILQMLAVHPDLLNDQAPPPASISVIQSLTSSPVTTQITGQSLSCPICLCIYEETDSMSTLPCHHQFHPLCIQAWLRQSGTCPVCRFVL